MIYLLGALREDLSCSEYLVGYHKIENTPAPYFSLEEECELQSIVSRLIDRRLIESAHDVSTGGLFVTLVESALPNNLGFDITSDAEMRLDAFLFGESQGRIVVSVSSETEAPFLDFMIEQRVPMMALGHVTKSEIRIDDTSYGFLPDYRALYDEAIGRIMNDD